MRLSACPYVSRSVPSAIRDFYTAVQKAPPEKRKGKGKYSHEKKRKKKIRNDKERKKERKKDTKKEKKKERKKERKRERKYKGGISTHSHLRD